MHFYGFNADIFRNVAIRAPIIILPVIVNTNLLKKVQENKCGKKWTQLKENAQIHYRFENRYANSNKSNEALTYNSYDFKSNVFVASTIFQLFLSYI